MPSGATEFSGKRGKTVTAGQPSKASKLSRKADFDAVYRNGQRRSSSHFTVFLKANHLPESRFGFSIKRALGGAVVRNRMRRRIREVVRLHRQEISAGWDFARANISGRVHGQGEDSVVRPRAEG